MLLRRSLKIDWALKRCVSRPTDIRAKVEPVYDDVKIRVEYPREEIWPQCDVDC